MNKWQNIQKVEQGIWTVYIDVTDEELRPQDYFVWDDEETKKLIHDIVWGDLYWFQARARAYAADTMLGEAFIGACCYTNYDEFLKDNSAKDLAQSAIQEARFKLNELKKIVNVAQEA